MDRSSVPSPRPDCVYRGHIERVPRILLLLPTATYRAPDFLAAAGRLGVDVVVGSEHRQALAAAMGDRAVVVPLADPTAAVEAIADLHGRTPLDAVVAVDDQGVVIAAMAAERPGAPHNPPDAVAGTRDKAACGSGWPRPRPPARLSQSCRPGTDVAAAAGADIGYPCVVKPVSRSASQGVIRVDDAGQAEAAASPGDRATIIGNDHGAPVRRALRARGRSGRRGPAPRGTSSRCWPCSTSPTPWTVPSSKRPSTSRPRAIRRRVQAAARGHGGPGGDGAGAGGRAGARRAARSAPPARLTMLELAARSIGGLCGRSLRFGAGASLEEIILRHALGMGSTA